MSSQKNKSSDVPEPVVKARDGQGSPVAILAIALAGGIGYFTWQLWKKIKTQTESDKDVGRTPATREEVRT